MTSAVIVDALRTPIGRGRPGGALAGVHAVDLLAHAIGALVRRTGIDPAEVDDVLVGCVSQIGEQAATVGRMAWLAAGLPAHVPAATIDRKCASSQQAAHFAAQGIAAGAYDMVVVAGVESMSRVPMGMSRAGMDPHGPLVKRRYEPGLVSQGVAAELVAARWGLSRETLDAYSAESHRRAADCAAAGDFEREIVPIDVQGADGVELISADETIRASTTTEALAELAPAFADPEVAERFPAIDWRITAGSSSQLADGASAMLVMSEQRARALGLTPRARFTGLSVVADDPILMLTGPLEATRRVLKNAGISIAELDHIEINEAFASVPLAWLAEFDVNPQLVNPRGGAIALGHPLGASGCRLMTTMLTALEDTGGRYGLQSMCAAGGMANATIIERLG